MRWCVICSEFFEVKIADFNCAEECQAPNFEIFDAQGGVMPWQQPFASICLSPIVIALGSVNGQVLKTLPLPSASERRMMLSTEELSDCGTALITCVSVREKGCRIYCKPWFGWKKTR